MIGLTRKDATSQNRPRRNGDAGVDCHGKAPAAATPTPTVTLVAPWGRKRPQGAITCGCPGVRHIVESIPHTPQRLPDEVLAWAGPYHHRAGLAVS
ncbi:hypothetical protein PtA15_2A290 [Puccinia triticina]|uniref:Uncharacterized protein n=1 Tax=Puccinia triticina TaxID=208348 RepID=A0ABY7CDI3_9BASI|nr:uncharacterized protein PtA15_2A290 [Puccinia triticina]WAQ81977.1 hypothetical protein PtA15_2A290 [Puccinia triticina]